MSCQSPLGNCYTQGDLLRLIGNFQDDNKNFVDPSTVTLKIKSPDGTITTLVFDTDPIVKDGTGIYHYDYTVVQAGQYYYRWIGTGACQVQKETPFYIPPSNIIPTTG